MTRSAFDDFCREAFRFLQEHHVRHIVIGGLAVTVVGEPRTTADADVIAFLAVEEAETLIGEAVAAGFEIQPEVERERLHTTGTLCFRRGPFQLDIILASLPFEEEALKRASRRKLFGLMLSFPRPEDLIVFKVLAGRQKDLLDAEGIARRHAGRLDRRLMEETIRPLCDLAEDMTAWNRLQDVLRKGAGR